MYYTFDDPNTYSNPLLKGLIHLKPDLDVKGKNHKDRLFLQVAQNLFPNATPSYKDLWYRRFLKKRSIRHAIDFYGDSDVLKRANRITQCINLMRDARKTKTSGLPPSVGHSFRTRS